MADNDSNTEAAPASVEPDTGDDIEAQEAVYSIEVDVVVVLGTAMMPINQVLKLGRGAVVQLERLVEEDVDLYANDILIAKGEVVVNDDRLGVSLTKVMKANIKSI